MTKEFVTLSGTTRGFQTIAGTFTVAGSELATADETLVASTKIVGQTTVKIEVGKKNTVTVEYPAVHRYSALDIDIKGLPLSIAGELLTVTVLDWRTGGMLVEYITGGNSSR